MPRFVVLEHHWNGVHWDFMLESADALKTWALEQTPDQPGPIRARQLPDHRTMYLDYEGPISGNRGHVIRWDRGHYHGTIGTESVVVELEGDRIRGTAYLRRVDGDVWEFSLSASFARSGSEGGD